MPDLLDPLGDAGGADAVLGDESWLGAMLGFELALATALESERLIPQGVAAVIEETGLGTSCDVASIAAAGRGGGNPVIPMLAALNHAADEIASARGSSFGRASDFIHLGATSQDVLDSAAMSIARETLHVTLANLRKTASTLAGLAQLHRATPMAGRTLGQHASPVTFGLVAAGWLGGILDCIAQLSALGARLPFQYGGAVGSRGILYEVVRARRPESDVAEIVDSVLRTLGEQLSLRVSVPWPSNRMPIVELGSALAAVVGAIGSMAADINILSRTEIAEVSEQLAAGEGGSSAMPHKRNPVTSVLLVSASRRSPGLVSTLFQAQVTEDQRSTGAWHSEWQTVRELERLAIQASATAADLATRLEVDARRMRANLDFTDGLIFSERVSAILAESMGKSAAFQLVEEASRESVQTARPLQVVIAGRLVGNHDDALTSRVLAAFDPDQGLESAGAIIDEVLARAKELS
jgi:3-carboxy-cis,cis-muconate cycloisomerase